MSELYSIPYPSRIELTIKGSLFKVFVLKVETIGQVRNNISNFKSKYIKASHVCYAYRICNNNIDLFNSPIIDEFSTDAGEPSGTAGKPILNVLKHYKLINTILFVVRFFGGIKLGIPGLIKAYKNSSIKVLDDMKLNKWKLYKRIKIKYPYKVDKIIKNILFRYGSIIIKNEYLDNVVLIINIDIKNKQKVIQELKEKSNGTIQIIE